MEQRRFAMIAGGGTGGHVVPALAVARALVDRGHPVETVEIIASRRGQTSKSMLAEAGFPTTLLPGRGFSRRLRARSLLDNALAAAGLLRAMVAAQAVLRRRRPGVVVSVGGYASFAPALAAVALRIPLVLVNIDAVPGLAHRLLGGFASASAVAFPGTALPRAVVTGAPVRPEVMALDRSEVARDRARSALGLPAHRRTVAAFGGSLGSQRINAAVSQVAHRWRDRRDVSIYHVTGRRDWDQFGRPSAEVTGEDEACGGLAYRTVPFEDRMGDLYAAADVVVCRSGAQTIAELAATGVPSILVPLPGAPRDHQTANAKALVEAGGAWLVPDDQCDGERLCAELEKLLVDDNLMAEMGAGARETARGDDAAARVAELVDTCARREAT